MILEIARYKPTPDELEAEARVFEADGGADRGPLHALLVERIRFKKLMEAYADLASRAFTIG